MIHIFAKINWLWINLLTIHCPYTRNRILGKNRSWSIHCKLLNIYNAIEERKKKPTPKKPNNTCDPTVTVVHKCIMIAYTVQKKN